MRQVKHALVAFGSNLQLSGKDSVDIVHDAITAMGNLGLQPLAISHFYATSAVPAGIGPDYVNAAAVVESTRKPAELMAILHGIEADFGRKRVQRWGQRTLDLDLLAVGNLVWPDAVTQGHWRNLPLAQQMERTPDELILPHPRMQDRAFVLVPLADVAADWRHPVLGLTVRQMLARLPAADVAAVRPI
jgi:2-amino-4-hydroxy-6-hydroxymethyldihydropteridine diphosphokinase